MTEETAPYVVTPTPPYVAPTEEKKAFLKAFAAAQGEFEPIVKNKTARIRPGADAKSQAEYTFDYAELGEILAKTRPALAKHGISTRSRVVPDGDGVWIESILAHAEGYEDFSVIRVTMGTDVKQFGGRVSYMRRYLKVAHLDLATEDDIDEDGEGAGEITMGGPARGYTSPPARKPPQPRAAAPKPAAASAPAPAAAPAQTGNVATQESPETGNVATETDPRQAQLPVDAAQEAPTGEAVTKSQAKWLKGKLDAGPFTDAERDKWLADHGIKSFEMLPVERFAAVNAELLAME